LIDQNGTIQSFLCIYKSRKSSLDFRFWKKWFFHICLDCSSWETNYILDHNFWLIFPNVLKFSAQEIKDIPRPYLLLKFGPKTWKSLVIHTCPKLPCCQKMQFGPLRVNSRNNTQLDIETYLGVDIFIWTTTSDI